PLGICTAALGAPGVVLTARHCVAKADDQVACNPDGTPVLDAKVMQVTIHIRAEGQQPNLRPPARHPDRSAARPSTSHSLDSTFRRERPCALVGDARLGLGPSTA